MIDLEQLIRKRQDELRGRPLNWKDNIRDRIRHADWFLICAMTAYSFWAIGYMLIKLVELGFIT